MILVDIDLRSTRAEFFENIQNAVNLNNDSNYILGIPCSVHNTFQQCHTSQSSVAYTFEGEVRRINNSDRSQFHNSSCIPEIGFLMDSLFAIQVTSAGGVVC
jgi:hypothetical protein